MQQLSIRSASGFTLLETAVATGIVITTLAGIAQLLILSGRLSTLSGQRADAVRAAQTKIEALKALAFRFTSDGAVETDPDLEPSPGGSLLADIDGYVDYPDDLVRRWAISALDGREPDAVVIEVCVFRAPGDGVPLSGAESCLATIRGRRP